MNKNEINYFPIKVEFSRITKSQIKKIGSQIILK